MRSNIRLGRILGIPIGLNVSWFPALGLVVSLLLLRVYPDISPASRWLLAWISALLFFIWIVIHELAHSIVALRLGIPVKEITLFFLGGVARIAREASRPRDELVMAAAGPIASLLLSGFFFLLWLVSGGGDGALPTLWQWLWLMNLAMGLFNLVPGFPMDGGRVFRALLWGMMGSHYKSTLVSARLGQGIALGLIGFGAFVALPGNVVPDMAPVNGIWLMMIGVFLNASASQSYAQTRLLEELRQYKVGRAMSKLPMSVSEDMSVAEALGWCGPKGYLLVRTGDNVSGVVEGRRLGEVPAPHREGIRVASVMTAAKQAAVISPDGDMAEAVQIMETEEVSHLPVVEEGRVVGYVGKDSLWALVQRPSPAA